jgi:hypothetical protein
VVVVVVVLFLYETRVEGNPLLLEPFIGLMHQLWMKDRDVRFEVFTAVTMKNSVF